MSRRRAAPVHVELQQQGGIAGLNRKIVLDGSLLRVEEHGELRTEQQLTSSQVGEVTDLLSELDGQAPRPNYGDGRSIPDAISFWLTYATPAGTTAISVQSGGDPPPEPFLKLVRRLGDYAR